MNADEMRERARQYRDMARVFVDARANKALLDVADEYEALAERTEAGELPNDDGPT
jgi:hypothetical protein